MSKSDEAWFRWEANFALKWCPVVVYGEIAKPQKESAHLFSPAVRVPADCLADDGSPMFGELTQRFPAPQPIKQ